MINRYDTPEISNLWSEHAKFSTYLKVEVALLKAIEGKLIPKGMASQFESAKINPSRIDEIEQTTKHDIIAFCSSITEQLPTEVGKFFHFGVTSSDIIDTSITLQIKQSLSVILPEFKNLLETLKASAIEHKKTITIGRSHGMYAEPLSFGQKILGFYAEFSRRYQELEDFYHNECTGQFSGAVGNYTILTPEIEAQACKLLGLKPEALSTQVIPRDRIAKLISLNALTASAIERLATEIRHLHRSEVAEVYEGFSKGQKGSSTMPHKKNPVSGENLTGMARLLRSHVTMALENIVLWHERDISHSSTERMYLPDNLGIMLYSLKRLNSTVKNLVVNKETMKQRVEDEKSFYSSYLLHRLLEKTALSREDIYPIVQDAAFKSKQATNSEQAKAILLETINSHLHKHNIELDLKDSLNVDNEHLFLGSVDSIFERVFEQYPIA